MFLMCKCRLDDTKTTALNNPKPEMNSDPNTPLWSKSDYELITQIDAEHKLWSINLNYINIDQIYHQNNTIITRTQIHYINEQTSKYKAEISY